jgi:ABC-type multidrug transport system ATPase subunit
VLELRDIHKSFSRRSVLQGVNLTVKKGEILGLLGPNGSGKSTTIRIAAGYYSADQGEVLIGGEPFGSKDRAKVGYLPERPPLYDALTVNQYLQFIANVKGVSGRQRSNAIKEVSQACLIDTVANQPIIQLSKGFRQRVGLAQMILGDPEVLLLDEPTNGLDPVQIIEAREMIRAQAQDRAVIYSSHIIQEVAALCTRIVILFNGRLTEVYRPDPSVINVEHLYVEAQVDAPAGLVQRLKSIAGMEDVRLEEGAVAPGLSKFKCISKGGLSLRSQVAEVVLASGQLFTLQPLDFDLEALFIEHIRHAREELESVV